MVGATPSFRGIEPFAPFREDGRDNAPMAQEHAAFASLLAAFSPDEQAKAKLAQTYTDIIIGPQRDNNFPSTRAGVRVGDLSESKRALVLRAIETYVADIDPPNAAAILAKYRAELPETFVSYSGTPTVNVQNDYVRIDGPSVWIELSMQPGQLLPEIHPHSVWRDRQTDSAEIASAIRRRRPVMANRVVSRPRHGLIGLLAVAAAFAANPSAHPMPNTVIAVSLGDDGARLDMAVPVPELRLALPATIPKTADLLAEPYRAAVIDYFLGHCIVRSVAGVTQAVTHQALTVEETRDETVGLYQELQIRLFVAATPTFDARSFTLGYDAVIHQVPNHFAVVQVVRDFRAGIIDRDAGGDLGIIRYDFSRDVTPPLAIAARPGSRWRGVSATVALGFHHVATGFDHLLFLATLLIVAPLRVVNGRWSLFQGWGYAARRFLTISLAFTLGHSLALLVGAYDLVPVPRRLIEVLIAASILVAAIHAIRPLFRGREWLVAASFGTVHGLAFAEGLSGLALSGGTRVLAVAGFNLGVEGAQLVAMACAVPLIAASRWRQFSRVRVATMTAAALVACVWMVERSLG